jgi:hypothetical protein
MPRKRLPVREMVKMKAVVDQESGCWNWTGARNQYGYAMMSFIKPDGRRSTTTATRIIYQEYFGPFPAGCYMCHHCDNPACVNPEHLFPGTQKENFADMAAKGRGNQGGWQKPESRKKRATITPEARLAAANDNRHQAIVAAEIGVGLSTIALWRSKYRTRAA